MGFVINSIWINFVAKMDFKHGNELVAKAASTSDYYDRQDIQQINQRKVLAVLKRKKNIYR